MKSLLLSSEQSFVLPQSDLSATKASAGGGVAHRQAGDWPQSLVVFDKAGLLALGPQA